MGSIIRYRDEQGIIAIAWALIELEEIGHTVTKTGENGPPLRRVDLGPELTSREVISFAVEATSRASSRLRDVPHERRVNRT